MTWGAMLLPWSVSTAVSPAEVIYVGDSQVDEQAAKAAGIPFVAYRNPDLTAGHHIRHLAEMADLLSLERLER